MSQSNPDLVILHLSDLHFGPFLQGVTRKGEWSYFAASHSFNLLQGVETRIHQIYNKFKDRLIVVVTGDLTTAAEPPAYEAVNNYLRDNPFVSSFARVGLNFQEIKERLFVVPGNHDLWLYGRWFTRWTRYVNRKDEYIKYFPMQLPHSYPLLINGIPITIFTVDSNRVKQFNPINFINVLGRGEVGTEQIADIQALHNNLLKNSFPEIPSGFSYHDSLKIALIHHHLEVPSTITPNSLEQSLLKLSDAPSVLNLFSNIGIHIVLCGHEHFPYQINDLKSSDHPNHSIFLSCAGSASQIDCPTNSFSIYEISRCAASFEINTILYEAADAKKNKFYFKETNPSRASVKLDDIRI